MASPFFGPPPLRVVGSSPPHPAASPEIGSTTNTAEMIDGSAAAAGVRFGAMGGAPAPPGRPQLKRPPAPVMLTPPLGQATPAGPELAQSYVPPLAAMNLREPSTLSQPEGAATASSAPNPSSNAIAPAQANLGHGDFLMVVV